jgi:hypothetical protein
MIFSQFATWACAVIAASRVTLLSCGNVSYFVLYLPIVHNCYLIP